MAAKTKIWLICALCFILAGGIVFVCAFSAVNFDFTRLSTEQYTNHTYDISEPFSRVFISSDITDVEFIPSQDGNCKVICKDGESFSHQVTVSGDTLRIQGKDTRKWHDYIGVFLGSPKVTVYLPSAIYETISVRTDTGNIRLTDVNCQYLQVITDTGDVTLKSVITENKMSIETDTGDVEFTDCDSASIFVETDTGDVTGSLLTEKIFICKSSTGDIRVPESITGGKCKIETDTGDISITIMEKP